MAQEITLPVKLQLDNLQSIVKEMRSQLGNLKVDSTGYKKLENVINGIEKKIQDIQVIASRPIMNEKQFSTIEKDISHIYDDVTKLGIEAGRIKFSDLQLTGEQKQHLQEFDNQLKIIKEDLKHVEDSAKTAFLGTDLGKLWQENNPKDATKSFSEITKTIEIEVAKQKKAVEEAKAAYNDYQNTIQVSKNINSFMRSNDNLADRIKASGIFDQIFREKDNNFKNGGRNLLESWLKSEFSLSEEAIKNITQGSGSQVLKAFTEMQDNVRAVLKSEQSRLSAERKTAIDSTNNGKTLTDRIATEEAKQQTINATQNEAVKAKEASAQAEVSLRKEEEATQTARNTYINGLTNQARGILQMGGACDQAKAQLVSLNNTVVEGKSKLASLDQATSRLQGISNFVNRYVGAYAIIRKVSTAIRNAFNNIKELDKVITSIAVVTNMSQEDLWNKVGQYTTMAQEYGVATKDVYTVSQIFYQQGLQTAQVMDLTVETLKMAKIAGMEYSAAANAMTVAVRAFRIEMSDAQQVTDTYSALAAKFAVSSAEIANAMEKTASSAASVGMSLQSTSAFMSVMIQTTRESAQNIGSALKSIISRYGEMKASPSSLINVDGEEVAFNKVDTALASIGISIKDATGQFRDFDDVIMELAAKWSTLDNNTQRYIATVMAGNRQQSRFIALVSNYDELSRAMSVASNAENASIVQVGKTMDSLESKANQLKNAFSQLYLDLHIENGLKNIYDWLTRIITTVGKLGTLSGAIPTLMNIFGFGTGLKSGIKQISDNIQTKKLKIETDNSEYQKEIERIENDLAKPRELKITTQVDDSQLQAAKNEILFMNNSALATTAMSTANQFSMLGNKAGNNGTERLNYLMSALAHGQFKDEDSRRKFLTEEMGMDEESPIFNDFMISLEKLSNSANNASNSIDNLDKNSNNTSKDVKTLGTDAKVTGEQTKSLGQKSETAGRQAEEAGNKAKGAGEKAEQGGKDWKTGITKGTAIFSTAARLIGTAITAFGASYQDKSTDQVETSKLLTGIGNGLSMAGTGAQLGMMTGQWWGPIIGAIGGLLFGGASAIIDSLNMTLAEKLSLQKSEAAKASDESLKAQAKAIDLNSSIDNITKLKKAMYDSTDSMQQYKDAMSALADQYPQLISGYDEAGNAIIDLTSAEQLLAQTRLEAARAARESSISEGVYASSQLDAVRELQAELVTMQEGSTSQTIGTLGGAITQNQSAEKIQVSADSEQTIEIVSSSTTANGITSTDAPLKALDEILKYVDSETLTNLGIQNNSAEAMTAQEIQTFIKYIETEGTRWTSLFGDVRYDLPNGFKPNLGRNTTINGWDNFVKEVLSFDLDQPESIGGPMYYSTDKLNKIFEEYKDTDLFGGKTTAEDYWGQDKFTYDEIQDKLADVGKLVESYEKRVANINTQTGYALSTEQLYDTALSSTNIGTEDILNLQSNGIYSRLFNKILGQNLPENINNILDWYQKDQEGFAADSRIIANNFINWYNSLTEQQHLALETLDFTQYTGAEQIAHELDVTAESNPEVYDAITSQFIESNENNRNRILQLIYNEDGTFNSSALGSLESLESKYGVAQIAEFFESDKNGSSEIISKYADYFTTQLLNINKLAEDGYTNLASTRLSILSELATTLSQIDDSKIQNELFATITSIDLSNYDTIVKAIDSIKSYEQINGQTAETSLMIKQLEAAKNSLIFNVNTLVQDLTESISSAAKNIDSTLGTNKSGMDLSKALDTLNQLNVTRSAEEAFSFDEIFTFDAVLGKYIYTVNGLNEALAQNENKLQDEASQLENTIDKYVSTESLDKLYNIFSDTAYTKESDASEIAYALYGLSPMKKENIGIYEDLIKQFQQQDDVEFTWNNLITFLKERRENDERLKELTDEQLEAYRANIKNQYFQNIDWSSIALGTDYTGSNKMTMDKLISELGMAADSTWEQVVDKYLDELYEDNSAGKVAAKAKINDSIIQTRISQYQSGISELLNYSANKYLSEQTKDLLNKKGIPLEDLEKNAQNTIKAAKIFLSTLAKQIGQAGYTLEQYNQDAGSILEQTLSKQSIGKTLLDFASSDSINASSLESLANSLNLQLTDLVDVETGIVKDALAGHLVFNKNTGAYDITTSFEDFIDALNAKYGNVIDKTSQQYVEALKSWNDTQIEKEHKVDKAVTEELQSILKMQPGEQLNLAQTYTAIQSHLGSLYSQFEDETLGRLGADFENGILTIRKGANVQGIIQAIAQQATNAGALLPEEFEQIKQALVDALRDIANIISNGIDGSISADNRRTLENWAKDHNIGDLQFTETAEGFQLATESAKELYRAIEDIDHLQGQVIFEKLKDNLIETDERFKSVTASVGYTKQLQSSGYGLTEGAKNFVSGLNGNVDLYNRPVITNADGSISTLLTATEDSRNYESDIPWVMNITPITPAGEELDDDKLQKYIQDLVEESGGNMDEMIKLDKSQLGLIIEGENTEIDQQEKILDAYDERAEKLHEISAAIEENKNKSAEELALAQQINEARGLTEDDSFSFMDNEIPSGQNNPLNYWQSWSDAYTAIQDSISGTNKGTMDYTDFYNIITEMGNLTEITGQAITLGEQTFFNASEAADLITKAAGALQVQADGSLKIDLSQIGVDFASGADALNENVANGIQQLSASQIEMLDSLISLLEVIVTMEEAFKNLDVDSDLNLSLDEMFNLDGAENITGFSETWEKSLETMREMLSPDLEKYNEDFARGMESIKFTINDKLLSLADIIQMDFSEVESTMGTDFYNTLMNSIYQAALSGDYSETNVKEIIMQKLREGLEGTDTEITFDMGNYTFIGTSNGTVEINWDKQSVQDAVERHGREAILEAKKAVANGSATTTQIEYSLEADGIVYVKNGTNTIKGPDGKEYSYGETGYSEALAAGMLQDLGNVKNIQMGAKNTATATGTITWGKFELQVAANANKGNTIFTSKTDDGYTITATSQEDFINQLVEKRYSNWESLNSDASDQVKAETKIKLQYEAEVEAGISSFELNSQSYQKISDESRTRLETALASGSAAEIQLAIQADPELSSLEGLSSSEIEEKLGLKEVKMKIVGDTEEATTQITTLGETVTTLVGNENKITVTADVSKAATSLRTVESKEKAVEDHSPINIDVKAPNASKVATSLQTIINKQETINDTKVIVDVSTSGDVAATQSALADINSQLMSIAQNKIQNIQITETTTKVTSGGGNTNSTVVMEQATGNVGLAKAQGTLMGELGPELVVSNGKYFVAGQSGPEMVNLADDAIVFNHLQTEQLLKHGTSTGRGQAITSERNAVAFAGGNISGPAMASASSVLATLKQLRALWQSLQGTTAQDLAGLGGSGSGGGGGGDDGVTARNSYLADVERWYNWLQKIAVLEEKINTEEAKRSKYQASMVAQGAEYAKSNLQTLKDLESEAITYQALANTQQEFFNLRRSQLNDSAFSRFYTFDENGQLKYNDNDLGYKFLAELMARDDYGEAKYSAEQQYNMLVGAGMEAYMKYDSSGTEILMDEDSEDQSSFYSSSVQAFWDLVDSQKEEMQTLHDSINEYGDSVIEKQTAAYEIMKEIEDNQISVEDKVYNALVDLRQRAIDELQNQRDAIEKASNNLINGLTEQLNKEKDMYSQTESTNELYSLQRQLAVLQRSGGAASAIASLQKEIASKQQDMYYDAQQRQIDALQEASDNELEKLDEEISLMTETLEYEKEHGFLWQEIADIMRGSPEDIATYIFQNDSQFWGDSPTKQTQTYREALFEAGQFVEYRNNITGGIDKLAQQFSDYVISQKAQEEAANKSTSTGSSSSGGGGGSGGGSDDEDSSGSGSSSTSGTTTSAGASSTNKTNIGAAVAAGFSAGASTMGTSAKSVTENFFTKAQIILNNADKVLESQKKNTTTSATSSNFFTKAQQILSNAGSIIGKKASGGYVSHGIYELGEQGTETVLTAQQTKILRDNILSNRPNSLLSLLKSYNESYDGITDSTKSITPIEDNSVTIEQAVVEMHVSKIANDYDAQRAGEQALEKMLTIARKTSAQNRIGR